MIDGNKRQNVHNFDHFLRSYYQVLIKHDLALCKASYIQRNVGVTGVTDFAGLTDFTGFTDFTDVTGFTHFTDVTGFTDFTGVTGITNLTSFTDFTGVT